MILIYTQECKVPLWHVICLLYQSIKHVFNIASIACRPWGYTDIAASLCSGSIECSCGIPSNKCDGNYEQGTGPVVWEQNGKWLPKGPWRKLSWPLKKSWILLFSL